jgi:hypothetical protein
MDSDRDSFFSWTARRKTEKEIARTDGNRGKSFFIVILLLFTGTGLENTGTLRRNPSLPN